MNSRVQFWVLVVLVVAAVVVAMVMGNVYVGPRDSDTPKASKPDYGLLTILLVLLAVSWLAFVSLLLFYKTRFVQWPVVVGTILLVFGTDRFVRMLDKKERSMLRKGDGLVSMISLGVSVFVFGIYILSIRAISTQQGKDKYAELATYLEGKEGITAREERVVGDAEVSSLLSRALDLELAVNDTQLGTIIERLQGHFEAGEGTDSKINFKERQDLDAALASMASMAKSM